MLGQNFGLPGHLITAIIIIYQAHRQNMCGRDRIQITSQGLRNTVRFAVKVIYCRPSRGEFFIKRHNQAKSMIFSLHAIFLPKNLQLKVNYCTSKGCVFHKKKKQSGQINDF